MPIWKCVQGFLSLLLEMREMYFFTMKTYLWKKEKRKIAKGREITESTIFDVHDFPLSLVDKLEIR